MKRWTVGLLAPLALIALLGGCKKGDAPKGQVVATVGDQEITLAELQAEVGGPLPADPKAAKAIEQTALQRIIARDLLAQAAHDQKLDQTPQFALQLSRAKKDLQANALERKMASEVPPPTRDEADRYVADHPTMFAQRQLILVDQIQAPRTNDADLLKALEPLKDLTAAEALLNSRNIPHQRTLATVDTLRQDPRLVDQIERLGANDLFIVNTQNALTINQVKETRPMALSGDAAAQLALRVMTSQRSQDAVSKQANAILSAAASKIQYNADYRPASGGAQGVASAPPAAADRTPAGSQISTVVPTAPDAQQQAQPFALGK